jgi:DNA ligase (NAD+)
MLLEITAPTQCPECSTAIEEYTDPRSAVVTHWCTNDTCPGRLKDLLTFVASRDNLEIDDLGDELAGLLVGKGYVTTLADLFEFQVDAQQAIKRLGVEEFRKQTVLRHGLPASAVISMVQSMEKAKTARWDRWIASLSIPMIGVTLGKVIAERFKLTSESMGYLPYTLQEGLASQEIDGIGPHKLAELLGAAMSDAFKSLCWRLHEAGVRPTPLAVQAVVGNQLEGMSFVVTGEFNAIGSREYITAKLTSLGAVAKSGVTKKVTHLLVGESAGLSKLSKAAQLGIPHLTVEWLEKTFEDAGFSTVGSRFVVEGM